MKIIAITAALSLAIGSVIGYMLQKSESQPISGAAIAAEPKMVRLKPVATKRTELELKYALCTNSKLDTKTLSRLDDKTLNNLVYQVCTANS